MPRKNNPYHPLSTDESAKVPDQIVRTSPNDRLSSLFNSMRGYEEFVIDLEGIIIGSNLEVANITGYEEWEVIGKHFSIFYMPEERISGRPEEDLATARLSGKVFYSGWRLKKKGMSFWAKVRINLLRTDDGDVTGYRMVLKDTTHNVLYNYRVKRVRDEYLNLFNNSFIGIFKFRLNDAKFLLLNEKAREMLSMTDCEDGYFSDLFANTANYHGFLREILIDDSKNRETQLEYKGLWLSVSCRSFPHQGFAEGIITDITEKKKQLAELQRLNQEIDKFIYHSSHDMRSPLTTILGLTHLIALENPTASIQDYNTMIRVQVQHLDNLLKSLVNITFNKSEARHEPIDFERELEVVLREFRHQYHRVRVETVMKGEETFPSDPARIHIILKNLVSNAFRFHNPHSNDPFVRITIKKLKTEAVIDIEDNGIGIDESCLENIFTMFYKAERGSTGLGLYIVKSMVDKLGGSIEVQSKRWMGSGFRVQLPKI